MTTRHSAPLTCVAAVTFLAILPAGSLARPIHHLTFEQNLGQTDDRVQFVARSHRGTYWLADTEVVLALVPSLDAESDSRDILRLSFLGSMQGERLRGVDPVERKSHYFVGRDQERWIRDARHYRHVERRSLYPGIDVIYRDGYGYLQYDFTLAPGAAPESIRLVFDGEREVFMNEEGELVIRLAASTIVQPRPTIYQDFGDLRRHVDGGYLAHPDGSWGFWLGEYDRTHPLVIDPALVYSTHLGGSGDDQAFRLAVDAEGHAYLVGRTLSVDFPTQNPVQPAHGNPCTNTDCRDVFVAKLTPDGSNLVYSTYLGGNGEDTGFDVAADAAGGAYVTGTTHSEDFPTTPGSFQPECQLSPFDTCVAAFAAKLDATGSTLVYSTYISGAYNFNTNTGAFDKGHAIAVDGGGHAYVGGSTKSMGFPTTPGAVQETSGGGEDGFLLKLNPQGSALMYSTYVGGIQSDVISDVAVDASNHAHITGNTLSHPIQGNDFPVVNALQPNPLGNTDAFVGKVEPGGASMAFLTYLGGTNTDSGLSIAADGFGQTYVVGQTKSLDFPLANALFPTIPRLETTGSAFVTKLSADGSRWVYSTFLGGSGFDIPWDVATDAGGNAYVTGETTSADFPLVNAVQPVFRGADAFVTKLGSDGSNLPFSTYFGGSLLERATGIAVDGRGNVFVGGFTFSLDFPVANALQPVRAGGFDAFVSKLTQPCSLDVDLTYQTGHLSMDILVGSEEPVLWIMVLGGGGRWVPLWNMPLPEFLPVTFPLSVPFPNVGAVATYSLMVHETQGVICSDFAFTSTTP